MILRTSLTFRASSSEDLLDSSEVATGFEFDKEGLAFCELFEAGTGTLLLGFAIEALSVGVKVADMDWVLGEAPNLFAPLREGVVGMSWVLGEAPNLSAPLMEVVAEKGPGLRSPSVVGFAENGGIVLTCVTEELVSGDLANGFLSNAELPSEGDPNGLAVALVLLVDLPNTDTLVWAGCVNGFVVIEGRLWVALPKTVLEDWD